MFFGLLFSIATVTQEFGFREQTVASSAHKPVTKGFTRSDLPTCRFSILTMQKMLAQPGLQNIRSMAVCETDYPQLLRKRIVSLSASRWNKLLVSRNVIRYPIVPSPRYVGRSPSDPEQLYTGGLQRRPTSPVDLGNVA